MDNETEQKGLVNKFKSVSKNKESGRIDFVFENILNGKKLEDTIISITQEESYTLKSSLEEIL